MRRLRPSRRLRCPTVAHTTSNGARGHFSLRMQPRLRAALEERSREAGEAMGALAERYIEEGLKRDGHPEIVFWDGALGRRAMLAGTRLEVWQVAETIRRHEGSLEAAAEEVGQPLWRVRACLGYYAAFQEELDAYAERARQASARSEEAWRREQALLGA